MKNLKEFLALKERYETITLDEINSLGKFKSCRDYDNSTISKLTGFGHAETCSLCNAVDEDCDMCVHGCGLKYKYYSCVRDKTYKNIADAYTPELLLISLKKRAKYMDKLLTKNNIKP